MRKLTEAEQFQPVVSKFVEMARYEPVRFAKEVLRIKILPGEPKPGDANYNPQTTWAMDDWQKEMLNAVADVARKKAGKSTRCNHEAKPYVTIRAAQGVGKTFGIAVLAHVWGFAWDPMAICAIAPKLEHLKTRFFGEFGKIKARAIDGYAKLMEVQATHVYWNTAQPDNHLLVAETAKQPENIQGFRRTFTLYLTDESSGIEEVIFPVIEGNLSATEIGIYVGIGNPTRNEGHFARSHLDRKTDRDYYRMHVGPQNSRRIKQEWIDRMIRNYGKGSPVVQVRCYGEFADASPNQLVPLSYIERARINEFSNDGSLRRLRVSVDVADGGVDECVFTVGEHYDSFARMRKIKRASYPMSDSPIQAADQAEVLFKQFGGNKEQDDIVVDGLGVGAGTAGTLRARGYNVIVHRGGEGSDQPNRYRNKRVQASFNARDALRDNLVMFSDDCFESPEDWDDFCAQLCSIQTRLGLEKVDDLEPKAELVRRTGKSPDIAESFVMQWATQSRSIEPGSMAGMGSKDEAIVGESSVLEGLQ